MAGTARFLISCGLPLWCVAWVRRSTRIAQGERMAKKLSTGSGLSTDCGGWLDKRGERDMPRRLAGHGRRVGEGGRRRQRGDRGKAPGGRRRAGGGKGLEET